MPEIPEIATLARQMDQAITGKTIAAVETLQPKCLNLPLEAFSQALVGATFLETRYHGKWIQSNTTLGWLLINLGMGGEVLLVDRQTLPAKWRIIFDFTDATCLALNFWWFGYAHYIPTAGLAAHVMTAKLGPNALDLAPTDLHALLKGQRGSLKTFLLDQSRLAGIGNAYVHDILFLARLHPQQKIDSLTELEIDRLAEAIQRGLRPSLEKGGSFYEKDLFGKTGGFTMEDIIIGYKENQPCPVCATPIVKIKTGSTSTFICPTCQPSE